MTEMCKNCPMRGAAIGELVTVYMCTTIKKLAPDGKWIETLGNPIGILVDEERNISEPFLLPDDRTDIFERIERKVTSCESKLPAEGNNNPQIFRRRNCPALGALAIKDRKLTKLLKRHAKAQLM